MYLSFYGGILGSLNSESQHVERRTTRTPRATRLASQEPLLFFRRNLSGLQLSVTPPPPDLRPQPHQNVLREPAKLV
ncbi:hypothetical protein AOLI_G00013920 [Acnodon oligacanthus]